VLPPHATSPVTVPSSGTSNSTPAASRRLGTFAMAIAPVSSVWASTTPAAVSTGCVPDVTRPRWSSVAIRPIMPWPHIPIGPERSKKMTPATQVGSLGGTSSAPTIGSDPRGSPTRSSHAARNRADMSARLAATVSPANSGKPASSTRVGSPPVCESMNPMRVRRSVMRISRSRNGRCRCRSVPRRPTGRRGGRFRVPCSVRSSRDRWRS